MDSASEKGALLQGLCPGISCAFNTHVQLFDWMTVKLVLSLWIIWLLPSLWRQVLRFRLQDNNCILRLPPSAQLLSDLTKNGGKTPEAWIGEKTQVRSEKTCQAMRISRRVRIHVGKECETPAPGGVSGSAEFCCRAHHCCLHLLRFLSPPLRLANLGTIWNGNTRQEGGGRFLTKCRHCPVGRRRVLQLAAGWAR